MASETYCTPHEIPGHITRSEGLWLSAMAQDKTVLEVGAFRGRSTVYLGLSASLLLTCDHFEGQKKLIPGQRLADFHEVESDWHKNIQRFGLAHKIRLFHVKSEECYVQLLGRVDIGLVFVDGGHDSEAMANDVRFAELLAPNGIIAFHDFHSEKFPAVRIAVDRWSSDYYLSFRRINAVGSIAAFQRIC